MERHDLEFEVKVADEAAGTFEGYASTFGNVDNGGDKVVPGAFVEGLKRARETGRSIKVLWCHDQTQPLGVMDDIAEDAKGLWVQGRLVTEVPKAREAIALGKVGALGGLSIGYRVKESKPDGNIRLLTKVDLYEVSLVAFPMNERAKIINIKSDDEIIEKLKAGVRLTEREFETLAKGLGLSNSQAERAARIHLKGPGEPVIAATEAQDFYRALLGR